MFHVALLVDKHKRNCSRPRRIQVFHGAERLRKVIRDFAVRTDHDKKPAPLLVYAWPLTSTYTKPTIRRSGSNPAHPWDSHLRFPWRRVIRYRTTHRRARLRRLDRYLSLRRRSKTLLQTIVIIHVIGAAKLVWITARIVPNIDETLL